MNVIIKTHADWMILMYNRYELYPLSKFISPNTPRAITMTQGVRYELHKPVIYYCFSSPSSNSRCNSLSMRLLLNAFTNKKIMFEIRFPPNASNSNWSQILEFYVDGLSSISIPSCLLLLPPKSSK